MDFGRQLADLMQGSEPAETPAPAKRIAKVIDPERLRRLTGLAEAAATFGTGLAASVPAGLAGMAQMIPTRGRTPDINKAAQTVEDVQGALTYLPRTPTGQRVLERGIGAMEMLGAPAEYIGEKTLQYTGSPGAATAANVLLDPVNFIGMPGSGKAIATGTKAVGRAAAAAPRVAGEMISDLMMPTSRAQAQRGAIDLGPQVPEFKPQGFEGLLSRADEALASLPRSKGTGAEFLRELQKTPGVKPAELEDRGLIDALSGMGKVTKADVLKVLQDNPPVQFEEVVLGGAGKLPDNLQNYYENSSRAVPQTPEGWVEHSERMERVAQQFQRQGQIAQADRMFELAQEMGAMAERLDTESGRAFSASKFSKYTIPGGENYREILLTIPSVGDGGASDWVPGLGRVTRPHPEAQEAPAYRSPHWEQPNVLAHARISDRIGPGGEKILHVEEVQSDWHQTGRKSGYKTGKEKEALEEAKWQYSIQKDLQKDYYKRADSYPEGSPERLEFIQKGNDLTPMLMKRDAEISRIRQAMEESVPDAPFKKNWHELMMKRLVDYAAKNGYDRIAITPGAEQASRYDLSKQISRVVYSPTTETLNAFDNSGKSVLIKSGVTPERVEDYIGKEPAKRLLDPQNTKSQLRGGKEDLYHEITGEDLQVGGEGMKGFYDKILPTYLNELGKPYGVKVGQMDLSYTPTAKQAQQGAADEALLSELGVEVPKAKRPMLHTFDITPQMREAIKSKGLPLYKKGGPVHISDNPDTMALELAGGGFVAAGKAAKAAAKAAEKAVEKKALSVPYDIPRAPAKTKEEIQAIAERMAKQMTGEFVRPDPAVSKNVAGKTFEQFKREKELEKDYVTRPTKDVTPPAVADIEKQKGMVKFGIPGDTTIANQELVQAGPYRLESPAPQHGGPMFPLGGEGAWASNNPIAKNVQTRIGEMSEFFDAPVLGQYMSMGPSGSMFAQHLADANLEAIDLSKMTKRQIEQFNKILREGNDKTGPRESFPGIQDKGDAYLYLSVDPKLRIYFNQLMQMPSITGPLGLPDGRVILDAITEPELRNKEIMTSGLSQFEFDPSVKPKDIPLSMHPTYSHLIPMREGAPVTRTRYPTPAELEFPDVTKFIREKYRPSEFTPTFQKASPRQKIDQQAIDEIKMYEEMMKSLTGKKKGGAVEMASGGGVGEKRDLSSKIAGGGIRGIITRGLLGMDPPEDITPKQREIYENAVRLSAPAQGLGVGKAIFIGAKAKTWNKAAADRAVEMERAGVNPEQIWRETGTFRGADGKLRQEISDVGAVHRNPKELQELGKTKKEEARELQLRLVGNPDQKDLFPKALTEAKRPVREQIKQLKEEADQLMLPSDTRGQSARFALEHPELYKAYPELRDIPVFQGGTGSGSELGSLRGAAGDLEMSVTQSGLRQSPRSTMLHEMQHAVQSLEGMSPGGSARMAFQDPKAFEILNQLRKEAYKPPSFEEFQRINKFPEDEARNAYAQFLKEREANPIIRPATERALQERAAMEYYKRLAGEAEARATQFREGMGPTQRRQEFPYSSYDVLPDDLIVKPPHKDITKKRGGKVKITDNLDTMRLAVQKRK